jgi:hypothetical protein
LSCEPWQKICGQNEQLAFVDNKLIRKGQMTFADYQSFFSPTDAQLDILKNNFKFALKLTLKGSYMFRYKNATI